MIPLLDVALAFLEMFLGKAGNGLPAKVIEAVTAAVDAIAAHKNDLVTAAALEAQRRPVPGEVPAPVAASVPAPAPAPAPAPTAAPVPGPTPQARIGFGGRPMNAPKMPTGKPRGIVAPMKPEAERPAPPPAPPADGSHIRRIPPIE